MRPPDGGTAGWAGAAMDPETGILYIPSRNQAVVIALYEPDPALGATVAYTHGAPERDRMEAQRAGRRTGPQMPQGLPLFKPPYSRITAIDMNTGDHVWAVPLGNGDRYRNHPRLRHLNLPPLGDGCDFWSGPDQDAAHHRKRYGKQHRRTAAGSVGQGNRRDTRFGGPSDRAHWHPDDLHGRREAAPRGRYRW